MNYFSCNVLSLLPSSLTSTATTSNDDTPSTTTAMMIHDEERKETRAEASCIDDDNGENMNTVISNEWMLSIPRIGPKNDMEFQIQSTIHSWSFCWNRGDIVGYCDGYRSNQKNNTDDDSHVNPSNNNPTTTTTTRYISISRHGNVTCIHGTTNITKFLTRVFEQCTKYQSKVIQESSDTSSSSKSAVAGYLEYSNLQIQYIPSLTTNHMGNDCISTTTRQNHAIVFGHYTLEFSPNNLHNEHGIFTLHLIQEIPSLSLSTKWQILSEHSSAIPKT